MEHSSLMFTCNKHKIINYLAVVVLLLAANSCITNKSNTYLQDDPKLPQYEKAEYSYYKIQPNDELIIRLISVNEEATAIFNISDSEGSGSNSYNYRVYDDGTIDLPFVSQIKVAGLTIREAAKQIEARLKDFAPDAMVKIALANDNFYIVGEGGRGAYKLYKEKLNIFQAISLSGDFSKNGDRKHVRIIRPNPEGGKPFIKEFDMRTASIIGSEFYYVQPNDVIYVSSIKGDFFKVQDYSSTIGSFSTSIGFLVTVINLGLSF